MVLEKTLERPLDCEEIQPVHPKGNQSWIFNGRTEAEAETPILWLPDMKNWLIGKDPDAGKDWRWEEKGTTEDEMVGWHHQLNGHEFEQLWEMVKEGKPGVLQSMGSQRVGHDWVTERLNWTEPVFLSPSWAMHLCDFYIKMNSVLGCYSWGSWKAWMCCSSAWHGGAGPCPAQAEDTLVWLKHQEVSTFLNHSSHWQPAPETPGY